MKRIILLTLAITALSLPAFAQGGATEKTERIERTLTLLGTDMSSLEVDNVQGAIHVSGFDGKTIEIVATKTIRGKSAADVALAEQEVNVDILQGSTNVRVYVDGPFRGRGRRSPQRDYEVFVNFEVRVPWVTQLSLKTVNAGDILVENTTGDFQFSNINGNVEVTRIAGSGRISTINGSIRVSFAGNPRADSAFSTVNGGIVIEFRPNLAANLQINTINGSVSTQIGPTSTTTSTGRPQSSNIQAGTGGPELKLSTVNGSIRVTTSS